jgi:hypothetical protein
MVVRMLVVARVVRASVRIGCGGLPGCALVAVDRSLRVAMCRVVVGLVGERRFVRIVPGGLSPRGVPGWRLGVTVRLAARPANDGQRQGEHAEQDDDAMEGKRPAHSGATMAHRRIPQCLMDFV